MRYLMLGLGQRMLQRFIFDIYVVVAFEETVRPVLYCQSSK